MVKITHVCRCREQTGSAFHSNDARNKQILCSDSLRPWEARWRDDGLIFPWVTGVTSVIVAASIHRRSSNHHTFLLFLLFFSAARLLLPFQSHVLMCTSREADLPPAVPSRCALSRHIPFLFLPQDAGLTWRVGANEPVWSVSSNSSGWTRWWSTFVHLSEVWESSISARLPKLYRTGNRRFRELLRHLLNFSNQIGTFLLSISV